MSYLISLDLPLWVSFILLAIALYLASKYYKWKAKYYEAQHKAENNALRLIKDFGRYKSELEKHQAEIKSLKAEAVERESLIEQLNKQIAQLTDKLHLANKDVELSDRIGNLLKDKIERLQADLDAYKYLSNSLDIKVSKWAFELDEKDELITKLQTDLNAAITVINRTERGRRQWAKHELKKSGEAVQKAVEKLQSSEAVVYDSIGVPTVVKADQGENDNGRHDVLKLSNEVVRGVKEQAQAIRNELQVDKVDLCTLEIGDNVVLRNKENRVVVDVFNNGALGRPFGITINKGTSTASLFYDKKGRYDCVKHSYDIIQIIKKSHV